MSGKAILTVKGSGTVALSRTGRILAMGSATGWSEYMRNGGKEYSVELWNVQSRKLITTKAGTLLGHVSSVAISSQGNVIASCLADGKIQVYNVRSKELREIGIYREDEEWDAYRYGPGTLSISGDGRFLARLYPDGTVQRYDLVAKNYLAPIEDAGRFGKIAGLCGDAAMSSTGMMVAAGSTHRNERDSFSYPIKIFDVTATPPIKIFDGAETPSTVLDSHSERIHALSFSADGNLLASASEDGSVKLWWTKGRRCLATLLAAGPGEWLIYTPDCRFTGSMVRSSRMWLDMHGISSEAPDSFRNQSSQERVAESLSEAFGVRPQSEKSHPRMSSSASGRFPPG
jgi:WD40 repeat protein